jgi:hypothetical protein
MHVSSRNMFPTTRNLQIRVHVYRPRHYCGDWLTFGCCVSMIADHNLVEKINNHGCWGKHAHILAKYLTADNPVFQCSNANDMRVTQDLNSFGKIIAHAQCSVDEIYRHVYIFRVYHIRIIAKIKLVHVTWNRQIPQ